MCKVDKVKRGMASESEDNIKQMRNEFRDKNLQMAEMEKINTLNFINLMDKRQFEDYVKEKRQLEDYIEQIRNELEEVDKKMKENWFENFGGPNASWLEGHQ